MDQIEIIKQGGIEDEIWALYIIFQNNKDYCWTGNIADVKSILESLEKNVLISDLLPFKIYWCFVIIDFTHFGKEQCFTFAKKLCNFDDLYLHIDIIKYSHDLKEKLKVNEFNNLVQFHFKYIVLITKAQFDRQKAIDDEAKDKLTAQITKYEKEFSENFVTKIDEYTPLKLLTFFPGFKSPIEDNKEI